MSAVRGYLANMRKRIADMLEKFSVASLVIGVYQGNAIGMIVGTLCAAACLALVWRDQR